MHKKGYVYILGNGRPTLYVGVTSDLEKRLYEHTHKIINGFAEKYSINKLLYFEEYNTIEEAIRREKQLKNWHRD